MFKAELNVKTKSIAGSGWLRAALKAAQTVLRLKKTYRISVALVSKGEIRSLNKKYRKKDKATDVLSFAVLRESRGKFIAPETGEVYLGEIVICPSAAKDSARKQGHGIKRELQALSIHGLLHLLGYKHRTVKDEKKMLSLQMKILQRIKI